MGGVGVKKKAGSEGGGAGGGGGGLGGAGGGLGGAGGGWCFILKNDRLSPDT